MATFLLPVIFTEIINVDEIINALTKNFSKRYKCCECKLMLGVTLDFCFHELARTHNI